MVKKICIVGLGYVGLPLAVSLSRHFEITGFDVDDKKIELLKNGQDPTGEGIEEEIKGSKIGFTKDAKKMCECDFIIVCVPTPVDENNEPDISFLQSASKIVGENIAKGAVVVYESTVYPGLTEEICVPAIEKASGLKCGEDFRVGYSPERINPGDKVHGVGSVVKIVSGMDDETLDIVDSVYSKITKTYRAPSIKVAEAAKIVENIQRDLNIALMNELANIFDRMDLDINQVIEAAATKWNFHKYKPGLVGGHCLGVDPYYMIHKAEKLGYTPELIIAQRKVNDDMHKLYAERITDAIEKRGINGKRLLVMGLTYKPNVSDHRNSRVKYLIEELNGNGFDVLACEPLLKNDVVEKGFGIKNSAFDDMHETIDFFVLAVAHDVFKDKLEKIPKEKLFTIN